MHRVMSSAKHEVTTLLAAIHAGNQEAKNQLFRVIERDLRVTAEAYLRRERPDHSLQATLLVDEAFVRLVDKGPWENRKHFYRTAARAMRRILIDHARKPKVDREVKELDKEVGGSLQPDLVALDEALQRLALFDSRMAEVVELHHFGGRALQETAELLGVSRSTVKNDWTMAKAWLHRELTRGDGSE